ncbi:phage holin [uncultured Eubacterium sp.]|uniref:phage holin n=1 Tax=uncultured Eubacterium sp. TaxID=165185 RepID=UPI0025936DD2|nr:phage holin [uncultured Eubacterium sp.]
MKKLNIKGLTPSSITTVVVLLIALINAVLQIFGINTIPITDDEVSEIVSILFLIVTSLYSTYKNFNVTPASQIAQNVTDAIKNGEIVEKDIEEILEKIKESRD